MTLITDYASLQTAVVEYLARDGDTTLENRVPTFIQFFESKANRELQCREMEVRAKTLTDPNSDEPEFIALPGDYQVMRRMRLIGVTGRPLVSFMSTVQMEEFRMGRGDAPGCPRYFSIFGTEIELAPTPDSAYSIEMIYRRSIPALATNGTNWLLQTSPDIYLYGALLEAAPYLDNDSRLTTWATLAQQARDALNQSSMDAEFNAGPLQVRVSGRTP